MSSGCHCFSNKCALCHEIHVYNVLFFLLQLSRFSLHLWLYQVDHTVPEWNIVFRLLEIHCNSWIWKFTFSSDLPRFQPFFSTFIFPDPFFFSSPSETTLTHIPEHLMLFQKSLRFFSFCFRLFSLCSLGWLVSINVFPSLMIFFPSVLSNMWLSEQSKFFFSYYTFQLCKYEQFFFDISNLWFAVFTQKVFLFSFFAIFITATTFLSAKSNICAYSASVYWVLFLPWAWITLFFFVAYLASFGGKENTVCSTL